MKLNNTKMCKEVINEYRKCCFEIHDAHYYRIFYSISNHVPLGNVVFHNLYDLICLRSDSSTGRANSL